MGLAEITAEIKTILEAVPGIGVVHEYERFAAEWGKFLEFFKDADGRINGWTIGLRKIPVEREFIPTVLRKHDFVLRGYYGLNDAAASELAFRNLVEAILDAFQDVDTLNDTVLDSGPMQVEKIEPRLFGKVLCHCAVLTIEARERVE